jgi:F0F1-type ATP synthase delta subunit
MKYSAYTYAQALAGAITDPNAAPSEEIMKNFIALVLKNGDGAHLKRIVAETVRLVHRKNDIRDVTLESARPLGEAQKKIALGHFAQPNDDTHEKISPELIAGVRVTVNDELQFDGSLRAKLDALFNT